MILKWNFKKWGVNLCTGFNWLSIMTNGNEPSVSIKAGNLLMSYYTMELTGWLVGWLVTLYEEDHYTCIGSHTVHGVTHGCS
jgi:hypothetical protein